jgi:hypothetical protein
MAESEAFRGKKVIACPMHWIISDDASRCDDPSARRQKPYYEAASRVPRPIDKGLARDRFD